MQLYERRLRDWEEVKTENIFDQRAPSMQNDKNKVQLRSEQRREREQERERESKSESEKRGEGYVIEESHLLDFLVAHFPGITV